MGNWQLPPGGRILGVDNRFHLRDTVYLQNWVFKVLTTKFSKSKSEKIEHAYDELRVKNSNDFLNLEGAL